MKLKNKFNVSFAFIAFVFVFLAVDSTADAALGNHTSYAGRSFDKLGRGLHDVVFCLGEIPYQISQAGQEHSGFRAAASGLLSGLHHTALRAVVGVFEIVTFYVPQEPILYPEYFFSGTREPKFPL